MNYELQIKEWLFADDSMMDILRAVRDLELPDCWIGAGFLRNKVWDELHNSQYRSLFDIDVIYFEEGGSEAEEHEQIARLKTRIPEGKWSVKNQARMHVRNGHSPYENCIDAISFWPETATAIAVRVTESDDLEFLAPNGFRDLFSLQIRKSPKASQQVFEERSRKKKWKSYWMYLTYGNE
jgi:hypothetical protein